MNWPWSTQTRPAPRHIPLDSICPACGHSGCTLKYVPRETVEIGEKKTQHLTEPMVERTCNTCGATCYEKTVLEPEKWVAK